MNSGRSLVTKDDHFPLAIFRIGFFPDLKGDDVVLVGADRDGMREFRAALRTAHGAGQAAFELHGVRHRVIREAGSAEIHFGWQVVNWRLDQYRITHTINLIDPLIVRPGPGPCSALKTPRNRRRSSTTTTFRSSTSCPSLGSSTGPCPMQRATTSQRMKPTRCG